MKNENKIVDRHYVLSNGIAIPMIGFGTWKIKEGNEAYKSVLHALSAGYRHIDTATMYKNERSIGRALKDSKINREELFITTKLPAQIKGYDETIREFNKSLKKLGLTYLDLYLIHAPWPWNRVGLDCTEGNIESWKAMIELYKAKKIRAIGVSNFDIKDIESIVKATGFMPHVNQIVFHVGKPQKEIREYCRKNKILVEAYSPLMTGHIFKVKELSQMANKYGVTPAQIALRYTIEESTLPLPKSIHEERMIENIKLDFHMSIEDVKALEDIII